MHRKTITPFIVVILAITLSLASCTCSVPQTMNTGTVPQIETPTQSASPPSVSAPTQSASPPSASTPTQSASPPSVSAPPPVWTSRIAPYAGTIDTDDLLNYMSTLVKYVHQPLSGPDELARLDLIYFLFEHSMEDTKSDFVRAVAYPYNRLSDKPRPAYLVGVNTLTDYLIAGFGIDPDYLKKYEDGTYAFQSESDYYDVRSDTFSFQDVGSLWMYGPAYTLSVHGTVIDIHGSAVTVRTTITPPEGVPESADYTFQVVTLDGFNIPYYRLLSVDIYDDARNAGSTAVLTVDGYDFHAPWYTVDRNGTTEYDMEGQDAYYAELPSWSYPDPVIEALPASLDEQGGFCLSGIRSCIIYNNSAYLTFVYYGVVDTYVYDIAGKVGRWMSGATELATFYKSELAELRKLETETDWNTYAFYRNYDVVTISQAHEYALIRRSTEMGEIRGEYLLKNLATGKETTICGSYTRNPNTIISFMDEAIYWLDGDHLLIRSVADVESGWQRQYVAAFDGKGWTVREIGAQINIIDQNDPDWRQKALDKINQPA